MEHKDTFPSLTGLKGLFIWLIIWFHTAPETPLLTSIPGGSFVKLYGGSLGNAMFFVLSGFLISWGYRERILSRSISFSNYVIKRLRKLYPAYFMSTVVMILLNILEFGPSGINLKMIVFDLLLQSGGGLESSQPYNVPGWFVSALFVCYLAYYFITYYAKSSTAYRCGIAFGIIWGYTLFKSNWNLPFCYEQNGRAFMNFFIGCALSEIYPRIPKTKRQWLQWISFITLLLSTYLLLRYGVEVISGDSTIAFAFLFCPMILFLAVENTICSRILASKPVLWLGNISMALYFWHCVIYVGYRWLLGFMDRSIGNLEFLLYVLILVLWCAIPATQGVHKNKVAA